MGFRFEYAAPRLSPHLSLPDPPPPPSCSQRACGVGSSLWFRSAARASPHLLPSFMLPPSPLPLPNHGPWPLGERHLRSQWGRPHGGTSPCRHTPHEDRGAMRGTTNGLREHDRIAAPRSLRHTPHEDPPPFPLLLLLHRPHGQLLSRIATRPFRHTSHKDRGLKGSSTYDFTWRDLMVAPFSSGHAPHKTSRGVFAWRCRALCQHNPARIAPHEVSTYGPGARGRMTSPRAHVSTSLKRIVPQVKLHLVRLWSVRLRAQAYFGAPFTRIVPHSELHLGRL